MTGEDMIQYGRRKYDTTWPTKNRYNMADEETIQHGRQRYDIIWPTKIRYKMADEVIRYNMADEDTIQHGRRISMNGKSETHKTIASAFGRTVVAVVPVSIRAASAALSAAAAAPDAAAAAAMLPLLQSHAPSSASRLLFPHFHPPITCSHR